MQFLFYNHLQTRLILEEKLRTIETCLWGRNIFVTKLLSYALKNIYIHKIICLILLFRFTVIGSHSHLLVRISTPLKIAPQT